VTIKGASNLHQKFYDALEKEDFDALEKLLDKHGEEVIEQFKSWTTLPESIRGDDEATTRYGESLVAIAQLFAHAGVPALMEQLAGPDEENRIVQWNQAIGQAQLLSEMGQYAESTAQLKVILADLQGARGGIVADLRAKLLGSLGQNAMRLGDYAVAVSYSQQALEVCRESGDEAGQFAYYDNLMVVQAIRALHEEPDRGRRLADVRRLVSRAQDAADGGRYKASLEEVSRVLAMIESAGEDQLLHALVPKVLGLMGFNEHKLGMSEEALDHTEAALELSRELGDVEGIRIYSANVAILDAG